MPPSPNRLREALLDSVDDRDEAIKESSETGAALLRRALAFVVTEAARSGSTEYDIDAALQSPEFRRALLIALAYSATVADRHATKAAALILMAPKDKDLGPIVKKELEARRAARASSPVLPSPLRDSTGQGAARPTRR